MIGASGIRKTPIVVPAARARSGPGRYFAMRPAQRMFRHSVITPRAKIRTFMFMIADGSDRSAPTGPSRGAAAPSSGSSWMRMMMMPIPDMNPETTTCGV